MSKKIEHTIQIDAEIKNVWEQLTHPNLIPLWMGEPEMNIEIITDWKVGNPISITGYHHVKFENKGLILNFEPLSILQYSHLSSLSHLPDVIDNYTVFTFKLMAIQNQTQLTLLVENFPTESIFKHLQLYWKPTLEIIKTKSEIHEIIT